MEPIIGLGTEPSQKASVPVIGKYGLLVFAENSISIKKVKSHKLLTET
jgi:hypothetical protein